MDNYDNRKIAPNYGRDEPMPLDDSDMSDTKISHSPLDLGAGSSAGTLKAKAAKPEVPSKPVRAVGGMPVEAAASSERITGVKTFFTKLHAGAIEFLDEQIKSWLKSNPDIRIKQTNMIMGEIQGKKTEPNIIMTVWY